MLLNTFPRKVASVSLAIAVALMMASAFVPEESNAQNPCAAKQLNPCNPCAAKNPCNPCGAVNPCNPCAAKNPCNPCATKNPCNPCGGAAIDPAKFVQGSRKLAQGSVAQGENLWNDNSLSSNGLACANCHIGGYAQMNASFAKSYPHHVAMPDQRAGVKQVNAAEMVQFCMLVPMASEPLDWSSTELASLAAYVESIQPGFKAPANPCAAQNPCNPCGGNPCNPCGAKNPCNPCGR